MGRNDTSRENIRYIFISFQDNTEELRLRRRPGGGQSEQVARPRLLRVEIVKNYTYK